MLAELEEFATVAGELLEERGCVLGIKGGRVEVVEEDCNVLLDSVCRVDQVLHL